VYEAFVKRYPSPRELGRASDEDLYRLLTPLGLRWRAGNVIAVAKELVSLSADALRNPSTLRRLPGVGDYVASTVQIMVSNRAEPVIDTNVIRVLGRYWGLAVHPEARRNREFKELAAGCVPKRDPKRYTLALLDLGASICIPRRPRCGDCPLKACCSFALNNLRDWEDAPREKSGKRVA
jgi:A/G-specific adenine glycosylase